MICFSLQSAFSWGTVNFLRDAKESGEDILNPEDCLDWQKGSSLRQRAGVNFPMWMMFTALGYLLTSLVNLGPTHWLLPLADRLTFSRLSDPIWVPL